MNLIIAQAYSKAFTTKEDVEQSLQTKSKTYQSPKIVEVLEKKKSLFKRICYKAQQKKNYYCKAIHLAFKEAVQVAPHLLRRFFPMAEVSLFWRIGGTRFEKPRGHVLQARVY